MIAQARAYVLEQVGRRELMQLRSKLERARPQKEANIRRSFTLEEAELSKRRTRAAQQQAKDGGSPDQLDWIKATQRGLAARREAALAALRREADLLRADDAQFIAHAMVIPIDQAARTAIEIEQRAMQLATAFEEADGWAVHDVHTPPLALKAGLHENPGFDLLSQHSSGERRHIEVKGRSGEGPVEMSRNEWAKACNLGNRYWLYVAYHCESGHPQLLRVQDPFAALLARSFERHQVREQDRQTGGVRISAQQIRTVGVQAVTPDDEMMDSRSTGQDSAANPIQPQETTT